MTVQMGGSNYISDTQLMAWLAERQDAIYGDMREQMGFADLRGQAQADIADIKLHLEEAKKSKDWASVEAELNEFTAKYGNVPGTEELVQTAQGMVTTMHERYEEERREHNQLMVEMLTILPEESLNEEGRTMLAAARANELPLPNDAAPDYSNSVEGWTKALDDKLDAMNKNDQLAMIDIQELKSTLDQNTQLTSTLIRGSNEAVDKVIGNIA